MKANPKINPKIPSQSAPQPLDQYQAIAPYQQGQSKISGREDAIKLSSNEGCFGPSPAAQEAYLSVASQLHRYPDGRQTSLRKAIASVFQLDANRIVCGNGSEEIIGLLIRCFVGSGDELLLSENHFVMCSIYGKAQGAKIVLVPEQQFKSDIDAIIEHITPRTKMIALANPNNPTGTYNDSAQIEKLIRAVPSHIVIVLDGAYAEYVDKSDYHAGEQWVDKYSNVVMTRTFSKAFGLAGLRIGWMYGPESIVEIVNRLRTPFNTSIEALAAAEAAVQDSAHVQRVVTHTRRWQEKFQSELRALGIFIVPSVTNFYLLHFEDIEGKSANGAGDYLRANGIIPRPASDDLCLRLTIGNDDENEAVLRVLRAYVED